MNGGFFLLADADDWIKAIIAIVVVSFSIINHLRGAAQAPKAKPAPKPVAPPRPKPAQNAADEFLREATKRALAAIP